MKEVIYVYLMIANKKLETKNLKLEENNNAMKKEIEDITKELEEAKKNEKRQINYANQLEKEKNDFIVKYNNLDNDCNDLLDWNEACEEEYIKFKKEADKSKKAEFAYKELLGLEYSDWCLGPGMAWRINKETGKLEKYKTPKKFDESEVEELVPDDDLIMCTFKYPNESYVFEDYKMYISLYERIGGKAFINIKRRTFYSNSGRFEKEEDMVLYIKSLGGKPVGKYWNKVLSFILDHQDKRFSTKDFYDFCKFSNRESCRLHLNKLIKWKIIHRVSTGLFEYVSC